MRRFASYIKSFPRKRESSEYCEIPAYEAVAELALSLRPRAERGGSNPDNILNSLDRHVALWAPRDDEDSSATASYAGMTATKLFLLVVLLISIAGCSGLNGTLDSAVVNLSGAPETEFTIRDANDLIGGPMATGRVGDVLLSNDKIRLIIEQPGKTAWVANFGGTIIDADIVRKNGVGADNFGFLHPLINIEWTVNVFDYEVVSNGRDGGPVVFRTYGVIDVYDYLDLDFISPVAKAMTDQTLFWSPQYDDANDPFTLTALKGLNTIVQTDYILDPGKNYVRIETTFENTGDDNLTFPVGEVVNGSGEVMFLIPGLGFTPEMMPQIQGDTPALIYTAFDGSDTSYGYFYDPAQFMKKDEDGIPRRLKTTSLSYSGVTGILFGEDFLKVLPLGGKSRTKVNFEIPAKSRRTITTYFVVGDGNAGSVFDSGLEAVGTETNTISGIVKNSAGDPLPGATVAVKNEEGGTIIAYRTDSEGRFEGRLSTGAREIDRVFGSGRYKLSVYKNGYRVSGTDLSGECNPDEIDIRDVPATGIMCTLGRSALLRFAGGVIDGDTGQKMPARLTVVGYVPPYRSKTGGDFEDQIIFDRPLGVVDVYYVNAKGTIGLEESDSIRLAPGRYELVFTRGTEYSMARIPVDVSGDLMNTIGPVKLNKVIDTTGFISADFHLHAIASPDSAMHPLRRALAAAGEGMDVLQSSDHDYLVDYTPYVSELGGEGLIAGGSMVTIVGQEISPNHMGHFNAFPLEHAGGKPCGGALDWAYTADDIAGPDPDFVMSPREIVRHLRGLTADPVIQINHLADLATSLFLLGGWVTTPYYYDSFGVEPLGSYSEPVKMRLHPDVDGSHYPYKYGESPVVVTDIDTLELTIGPELHDDFLVSSSLPTWFNLLNLGVIKTATGDSDSHREIANPVGAPRNFIASDIDPADGLGEFDSFDVDSYAEAIREHRIIVTTGPFVTVSAVSEAGGFASVGEVVEGGRIKFRIDVKSPEWAWFDKVDVYINTEPVPADDGTYYPVEGKAKDPAEFFAPYHIPRYYYEPSETFSLKDGSLANWKDEGGVISANIELEMEFEKDSWIVVFVSGTKGTEGYRSLFPFVTRALVDADNPSAEPSEAEIGNIDMLSLTGAPAWAFTNPIFVDVAGDGFDALYSDQWVVGNGHLVYKGSSQKKVNGGERATGVSRHAEQPPPPKADAKPATWVNGELFY